MAFRLSRLLTIAALTLSLALAAPRAHAATATYVEPASISDADLAALSTAGDGAGYFLGLNDTLALLLAQPIASATTSNVTIFMLAPNSGAASVTFRFGAYNNGSPVFVSQRNVQAGTSMNVSNLFQTGCTVFGGCDYIEITTTRTKGGASGVEIDYVEVDGQIVQVASPTPEPSIWVLSIAAGVLTTARLRTLRRRRASSESPPANQPKTPL